MRQELFQRCARNFCSGSLRASRAGNATGGIGDATDVANRVVAKATSFAVWLTPRVSRETGARYGLASLAPPVAELRPGLSKPCPHAAPPMPVRPFALAGVCDGPARGVGHEAPVDLRWFHMKPWRGRDERVPTGVQLAIGQPSLRLCCSTGSI